MTQARRQALQAVPFNDTVHPGLWIDKMLLIQNVKGGGDEGKGAKGEHIERLLRVKTPHGYKEAFKRWRDDHVAAGHTLAIATLQGRMVIGIGQKGPLEVGLTLHHTWGTPYIPGSALKGLAAATARDLVEDPAWLAPKDVTTDTEAGESYAYTFGLVTQRGAVIFHDAWWIPDKDKLPLAPDVMTVHHPSYYQQDNPAPPSDTDSPNPVSFITVTGTYLIALEGPKPWATAALDLLRIGLEDLGVGAKTRAGYGRASVGPILDLRPFTPEVWWEQAQEQSDALRDLTPARAYEAARLWLEGKLPLPNTTQKGATLDPQACEALLIAHLAPAIHHAQALLDGGGAEEDPGAALQRQLEEHEAAKPKDKKSKEFRKWSNDLERLKKKLEGAQVQANSAQRKNDMAERVLARLTPTPEDTP